jgi:hypothetical protein
MHTSYDFHLIVNLNLNLDMNKNQNQNQNNDVNGNGEHECECQDDHGRDSDNAGEREETHTHCGANGAATGGESMSGREQDRGKRPEPGLNIEVMRDCVKSCVLT